MPERHAGTAIAVFLASRSGGSPWHIREVIVFNLSPLFRSLTVCSLLASVGCSGDGRDGSRDEVPSGLAQEEAAPDPQATQDVPRLHCDPLAAEEQPIALGAIIAAGRAADNTLYVADRAPTGGSERVFASEGDVLVRRRVLGSGSHGDGAGRRTEHTWLFELGELKQRLFAEVRASAVSSLMVADDNGGRLLSDYGDARSLSVVEEAVVRGMQVRNLPGEVVLEYLSRVEDGNVLVVTRPRDDWSYDDFRLFFGVESQLLERAVDSVSRARDGGTTRIAFDVDGERYDALFPSLLSFPDGLPSLTAGSQSWTLTREDTSSADLTRLAFVCLR